jgi:hypothetical protein
MANEKSFLEIVPMMIFVEIITAILGAACFVMIALYGTWLLMHRLRQGDAKRLAFIQWICHIFEAVMGFRPV